MAAQEMWVLGIGVLVSNYLTFPRLVFSKPGGALRQRL